MRFLELSDKGDESICELDREGIKMNNTFM